MTTAHPFREVAWELLMTAQYRTGAQRDALNSFRRAAATLREGAGLTPGPRLRALEAAILTQDESLDIVSRPVVGGPELAERRRRMSGGPADPGNRFFGHVGTLDALSTALTNVGVLTVVGPTGSGKSRLVYEALRPVNRPVYWLDLTSVEASQLPEVLASHLGVGGTQPILRAAEALADDDAILVLDNADSVYDASVKLIGDLSATGEKLTVVVTSRGALNLDYETLVGVYPLDTDDAVALMLDRAFGLHPPERINRTALAELAEALDRLPIELELAAGYLTQYSPQAVLEVLRWDPGRLRHEDQLVSKFELYLDQLRPSDVKLLVVASVFAGPFRVNSLAAVAAMSQTDAEAAVGRLLSRSLITPADPRQPDGRFRVLRAVRAGIHLLDQDTSVARRRHAEWYAKLAARSSTLIYGPAEAETLRIVSEALGEIRTAYNWLIDNDEPELASEIVLGVWDFGFAALWFDTYDWGDRYLEKFDAEQARAPDALWATVALCHWVRGSHVRARHAIRKGLDWVEFHEADPHPRIFEAEFVIAADSGDLVAARAACERIVEAGERTGERSRVSIAFSYAAAASAHQGDREGACELSALALQHADLANNPSSMAWAATAEGLAISLEDPQRATKRLREAIRLSDEVDNRLIRGIAVEAYAEALSTSGNPRAALSVLADLIELWHRSGLRPMMGSAARYLAIVLAQIGRVEEAREVAALSISLGPSHPIFPRNEAQFAALDPPEIPAPDSGDPVATDRRVRLLLEYATAAVADFD